MQGARMRNLTLKGELNVRNIAKAIKRVDQALGGGAPIRIDASQVKAVDVAALQALVSAHKAARGRGVALQIRVPEGGAVATGLADCGLTGCAAPAARFDGDLWVGLGNHGTKTA